MTPSTTTLHRPGRPPVEVLRVGRNRHAPPIGSESLPQPVVEALGSIASDLRNLPRDCIGDGAELVTWLRRMAGRVDGVARLRVTLPRPAPRRPLGLGVRPAALSPRDVAEAVFGKAAPIGRPRQDIVITTRKGRRVPVEIRRARAGGQMEFVL